MNTTGNVTTAPQNAGPTTATHLGRYERELLSRVGTGWVQAWGSNEWTTPTVIAAYTDRDGAVRIGRVRSRRNYGTETVEVSPFPGAWETVPVSALMSVVHPDCL